MNTHVERQGYNQTRLCKGAPPRRQQGAVIVLTAIAMFVLLGIAAMSLDGGHMILNNARLQNIVDSAALEGAKVLSNGGSSAQAAGAAEAHLARNACGLGYQEIAEEMVVVCDLPNPPTIKTGVVGIDFNNILEIDGWSVPGIASFTFIRVTVNDLPLRPWFMQIFELSKGVSVSAVSAAKKNEICDFLPLVLCAGDPDAAFGGYTHGEVAVLKEAAGDEHTLDKGEFRLLKLPKGNGPPNVMINIAGGFDGCPTDFITKPGNNVGPVKKGLDTRFFDPTVPQLVNKFEADNHPFYAGGGPDDPPDDPPDPKLTFDQLGDGKIRWGDREIESPCEAEANGDDFTEHCLGRNYTTAYNTTASFHLDENVGKFHRRKVGVPIVNCEAGGGGTIPVDPIAIGCFFLLQPVQQGKGGEANIFGEFDTSCSVELPLLDGAAKIVLYKDPAPNRPDS